MSGHDDFYIGWQPQAPDGLAGRLRGVVVVLLVLVAVVAVLLVSRQGRFSPGVFEFGVERDFSGLVLETPYPALLTETGETFLLSAFGKHGAADFVRGLHGQPARLTGSLIYRDGRAMVEVHAVGTAEGLTLSTGAGVDHGEAVLTGEIVDSKCFLGVMKPGQAKPHRACAVRCISGGVPPVLLVVAEDGTARHLLLAGAEGEAVNREVLPFVAERVEIRGTVRSFGDLEVLYADPSGYRRVR